MAAPIRVGILNDMSDGPPGPSNIEPWLRFAADEVIAAGRIDREVEFIQAYGLGLAAGTAAAVERAYAELVRQDVLLIVGPPLGDNALVATPLAEHYRMPTINWAGAEHGRSRYMFQLQVGSHEEDSLVVARHVAGLGVKSVAVVFDRSHVGRRHFQFFQAEAELCGYRIAAMVAIAPLAENADDEVAQLLASGAEAIVYLGIGVCVPAVAKALSARGWDGPRAMNTAGIRGYAPATGKLLEGWAYVDMVSDHNRTLAAVRQKPGVPVGSLFNAAAGYDLGRLAAEGIARAYELTRDGLREGLERVKWLPAAEGYEGTLLGFGIWDRGALHGRFLVMRQWLGGMSVEIG